MSHQRAGIFLLLSVLLILPFVFAEVNGTIFTTQNITTGLYGYTTFVCNATSDCFGYTCFRDYDDVSNSTSAGWCNATGITGCYHNGIQNASGNKLCASTSQAVSCSNGVWTKTDCTPSQTCSGGICVANSTTTSTQQSSSTGGTPTSSQTIRITSTIGTINITQGQQKNASVIVKNVANETFYNFTMTASFPSSSWIAISPEKIARIFPGASETFIISISVPLTGDVRSHEGTVTIATSRSDVKVSQQFTVIVLPAQQTIENVIIPSLQEYLSTIDTLDKNITTLSSQGANVSFEQNLSLQIHQKLDEAKTLIAQEDYFAAKQRLDEVKALLTQLQNSVSKVTVPSLEFPWLLTLGILVLLVVGGVVVYLFWHRNEHPIIRRLDWKPLQLNMNIIEKIKSFIQRIKNRNESSYAIKK